MTGLKKLSVAIAGAAIAQIQIATLAGAGAVLSLTAIGSNSVQAIQIIPSGYQVKEISTGSFELIQASGLAIDKDNNIYVARNLFNGTSNLLKVSASGETTLLASFNTFVGGLAINSQGQIFGSLQENFGSGGSVFKIADTNVITFASGLSDTPEKLAFDQNNNLFVAAFNGKTVQKISPEGIVTTFVSGLEGPFGVAFQGETLFVGDNLNNGNGPGIIRKVTPQGSVNSFFEPVPGRIIDLEYAPGFDSFFVANQGTFVNSSIQPGTINVITNGQISTFATGFLGRPGQIDAFPRAIEFDTSGNLYVTDAQKLYKISRIHSTSIPESTSIFSLLTTGALGLGLIVKKKLA